MPGAMNTSRSGPADEDLRLLGSFAWMLSAERPEEGLVRALNCLMHALAADAWELFLVEPGSGDLLLWDCQGLHRAALLSTLRFPPGIGYPGIVTQNGQALATSRLQGDTRYLRQAVKDCGVQAYACAPLTNQGITLGSLHLTWHDSRAPLQRALELLQLVAGSISQTLAARFGGLRASVCRAIAGSDRLDDRLRYTLREIQRVAGTSLGTLALKTRESSGIYELSSAQDAVFRGRGAPTCECALTCPRLQQGRAALLDRSQENWPESCTRPPELTAGSCCLPLLAGGELLGAILLDYPEEVPRPLTRKLIPLRMMADELAAVLQEHRVPAPAGLRTLTSSRPAPALQLRCFGDFEISLGGRVLPPNAFARRQALPLLKLLVLHAGSALDRDVLIEFLWPGVKPSAGRNRLYGVVHALRSVIEPTMGRGHWRYIRNQGSLYSFNTQSSLRVDLYDFRKLLRAQDGTLPAPQRIAVLEQAVALYRGELFADEPYADWCLLERRELHRACMTALKELAALRSGRSELELAVRALQRALQLDPQREDLNRLLVTTLHTLGRPQEAEEQWRFFLQILEKNLGRHALPTMPGPLR